MDPKKTLLSYSAQEWEHDTSWLPNGRGFEADIQSV